MLRREAANWLARLHSDRDPDIDRKFVRWRDSDPRHAAAFDRVRRSYEAAGLLRHSSFAAAPQILRMSGARWQVRPALAAAAAIAVLLPLGVLLLRDRGLPFASREAVMLTTRVGEIRRVQLADGSSVTLDTATAMDVDIGPSRRTVHLKYGRARFRIAPAKAPFEVDTATATVTSGRAVIDVEQLAGQGLVRVLSGAAEVDGSRQDRAPPLGLSAGETAAVRAEGAPSKRLVSPPADWTRGMLQFDATPLPEAVELANRYSQRRILLVGDLNSLKVTAAFRAGDTLALARALAAAFHLSLEQRADSNLVLTGRTPAKSLEKRGG